MTDEIITEGSADFSVNGRNVRGLVLPWDEMAQGTSSTDTAPLAFPRGSVKLPADFSVLNANLLHDKREPIARFIALEETDKGIEAEFAVANSPEGDRLLADIASGAMRSLSAEIKNLIRNGAKAVSAVLTGAAFVPKGAFQSATVFSLAPDEENEEVSFDSLPEDLKAALAKLTELLGKNPDPAEAPAEPTSDNPVEDSTNTEEIIVTDAIMPDGVVTPEAPKKDLSASALFRNLASINTTGIGSTADFALADITQAGIGGDVEQAQWLGEVYADRTYTQKVLPLFGHGDLRSYSVTGFRWVTPPTVGLYAGNKAEIPSATVDTESYTVQAQRIAGGHDIDRKFRDFGNEAFWDGYFRHMASSYAKVADDYVFSIIEDAADANVVTVDDEGVTDPFQWLVDAALQVEANGVTPSFALVAPAVYKAILTKPKDQTLEFFNSAFGLTEGSFGGFTIRPHAGVASAGHKAIVGSRDAATVYELPGSPIRVEGLDVAKAGIDPALYGYLAVTINKANGLVVIDGDA